MKKLFIMMIRLYQNTISPDKSWIAFIVPKTPTCTMYPTCSEYMIGAIEKYGAIRGIFRGCRRILRCHPWQKQIIDLP